MSLSPHAIYRRAARLPFTVRVGRYLRLPARQPDYRCGRHHMAFLTNLPTTSAELRRRLRAVWNAEREVVAWPRDLVCQLSADKYTRPEWIRRR